LRSLHCVALDVCVQTGKKCATGVVLARNI